MRKRFARGGSIALAVGLVLSGGAALAGGASPAASVKFKSGAEAPFGGTRFDGAVVDGKVYFLGFRIVDNTTDGSIWTYDIKTKKYTDTKVDMPVPVSNYTIAVLKDNTGTGLYVFGGRDNDGASINTVQVFYPKTGKASVLKTDPFPGKTPSDCIAIPSTGVAVVGNKAYVLGGMSFSTSVPPCVDDVSKQTWSFDPMAKAKKKWKAGPALKTARGYITPAVIGTTIYAIGGDTNDAGTLNASPKVESWKVGAAKWSPETDMPVVGDLGIAGCDESQGFGFASGPLANTVTVAGCGQWPNALPDVLQYDVKKGKWSTVGALVEARRNQAGANIGSDSKPQLMLLGGYNSDGSLVLTTSEIGTAGGKASAPLGAAQAFGGSRASNF
jgi:Kelch motif